MKMSVKSAGGSARPPGNGLVSFLNSSIIFGILIYRSSIVLITTSL